MSQMISHEECQGIAKRAIANALREARVLAAKLANDRADEMERNGPEVTGVQALRAYAAALLAVGGKQ